MVWHLRELRTSTFHLGYSIDEKECAYWDAPWLTKGSPRPFTDCGLLLPLTWSFLFIILITAASSCELPVKRLHHQILRPRHPNAWKQADIATARGAPISFPPTTACIGTNFTDHNHHNCQYVELERRGSPGTGHAHLQDDMNGL